MYFIWNMLQHKRIAHLEELAKMLSPQTCQELASYGINQSGYYYIDADGPKNGSPPKPDYCNFTNNK